MVCVIDGECDIGIFSQQLQKQHSLDRLRCNNATQPQRTGGWHAIWNSSSTKPCLKPRPTLQPSRAHQYSTTLPLNLLLPIPVSNSPSTCTCNSLSTSLRSTAYTPAAFLLTVFTIFPLLPLSTAFSLFASPPTSLTSAPQASHLLLPFATPVFAILNFGQCAESGLLTSLRGEWRLRSPGY